MWCSMQHRTAALDGARHGRKNERITAINPGEAVEEKVSLSDRFRPLAGDFTAAARTNFSPWYRATSPISCIRMGGEQLERDALEWATTRGARSGRSPGNSCGSRGRTWACGCIRNLDFSTSRSPPAANTRPWTRVWRNAGDGLAAGISDVLRPSARASENFGFVLAKSSWFVCHPPHVQGCSRMRRPPPSGMMRLKRRGNAGRRRAIEKQAAQIPGDAN